ncbi:unnamed protein product [Moneuplotes crassus]|uniref:Cornichon n=1 Tax=Euplotes crassus TaxID=5936 RepID=A0AAD1Y6S0_EUPCR|nr:unnamed protein product [Moneuplotes crassus]
MENVGVYTSLLYLLDFFGNLSCSGISLFLMLSHEDVDCSALEPLELSDYLTSFQKIEILINICSFVVLLPFCNTYFLWALLPMFLYNCWMLLRKKYAHNFMFMTEYKNRSHTETVLTAKMIIYLLYVCISLFMFVFKFAEYLSYWY